MVIPTRMSDRAKSRIREIFLSLISNPTFVIWAQSSPLQSHSRFEYNRYRKADDEEVRDYVRYTHGKELRRALSTVRPGIGYYLPVIVEWLAFGQSRNDNPDECNDQEPAYNLQPNFIRALPYMARETFEEFSDGELGDPQAVEQSAWVYQN